MFCALFAINQCVTWVGVAVVRGGVAWDLSAFLRTIVLALVLLMLFSRSRRLEGVAALGALALVAWRMWLQPVR